MDERLKHRLVGFGVIFALAAIIAPIFIKTTKPVWKTRVEHRQFKIPTPPQKPEVVTHEITDEWKKPLQVAHISLDKEKKLATQKDVIVAEPLSHENTSEVSAIVESTVNTQSNHKTSPQIKLVEKKLKSQPIVSPAPKKLAQAALKPSFKARGQSRETRNHYRILLASFAHKDNAKKVLKKLKSMGFHSYLNEAKNKIGTRYTRVYVGDDYLKADAERVAGVLNKQFHLKANVVPSA